MSDPASQPPSGDAPSPRITHVEATLLSLFIGWGGDVPAVENMLAQIKAEARADEREKVLDEMDAAVATDAAMNHGNGYAEGVADERKRLAEKVEGLPDLPHGYPASILRSAVLALLAVPGDNPT